MGKTGSIEWVKIKGRKGRTIKVENKAALKAHSGPMQRYTSAGAKRRYMKRSPKAIVK